MLCLINDFDFDESKFFREQLFYINADKIDNVSKILAEFHINEDLSLRDYDRFL